MRVIVKTILQVLFVIAIMMIVSLFFPSRDEETPSETAIEAYRDKL